MRKGLPSRGRYGTALGREPLLHDALAVVLAIALTVGLRANVKLLLAEGFFVHLPTFLRRRCALPHRPMTVTRLYLESLEDRNLLSVDMHSRFRGMMAPPPPVPAHQPPDPLTEEPPDTIAAAGPDVIVEIVNGPLTFNVLTKLYETNASVAFYDKSGGGKLFQQVLKSPDPTNPNLGFFGSQLTGDLQISDPFVAYDELAGRFVIGILDYNDGSLPGPLKSRLDFGVSNDSNPLDGFKFARYDLNDGEGGFDFADYPRIGYNADAYVISFNMFPQPAFVRDHVDTLAIDKRTLAGHRVEVPGGASNFTMAPATMHDAQPGDPMWFTESASEAFGSTIGVVQMTNVLSDVPTFTINEVAVPDYFEFFLAFNPAVQPFSANPINTDDARIINSAMRSRQIVAAHAVGTNDNFVTHVRWYQFDTTGDAPVLVQMGDVNQAAGVYTYYPSIEINTRGDLGMTFMESSDTEYMSMYVTGRASTDPLNTMQRPVLTFAGQGVYQGFRAGDFSGTTVDPVDGITFWSANEYKPRDADWGTGIASFSISTASAPPGGANPSDSVDLFLQTSNPAMPALNPHAILRASSASPSALDLDVAVVDRFFDTSQAQKRNVISSEQVPRSRLVEDESWFDPLKALLPENRFV